ncbi:MAG: glycosyltransferase [Dehalococcoidia bacterium]|nr:MAG: glycosyltransferase [Dehalococcoidia bacterium]
MTPDQLRIAMLSVHSCPIGTLGSKDTGGMSVYIRELAHELGRIGHSVDIYTRAHDPDDDQIVELGNNTRVIHLRVGDVEHIHKLVLYTHLADMACSVENFRKSNALQYDLIHSHYWLSAWVGRQLQTWWHVPHITMFHTLGAVKNVIGIGEDEPELRVVSERELVSDCHKIIAATQKEKADLIHYYSAPQEKVSVIPCGVNLSLFQSMDRETARRHLGFNGYNIALFVGRVEPLKGIDQLFMAMPSLNRDREFKLVVIGGNDECEPELERLRNLSRDLNIQDSVVFIGTVRQEDLPFYYSAADVCVVPSYYESFGLVALESLACGTPVVATRVGGMESVVLPGKNGYLINNNAPALFAESIAMLISGQTDPGESAEVIRSSVTGFSWSNIAAKMIGEYKALLGESAKETN